MNINFSTRIFSFLLLFWVLSSVSNSQDNPYFAVYKTKPQVHHWLFNQYFDSVTGNWTRLADLSMPLMGINSYYYDAADKVFICGGLNPDSGARSSCYWYNISANQYEQAAPLPSGRWSGKLVRVKDSLYLIGSIGSSFNSPDGFIFKYSLTQNSWVIADTMPQPYVHECAAAVINDSLIVTIGGSTTTFSGAQNLVRIFNPYTKRWTRSPTPYPVNNSTSHAECLKIDTAYNIIVLGGYGAGALDKVIKGKVTLSESDTARITWSVIDSLNSELFGQAVYRVTGGKWNDFALFGPALNVGATVNQIWGVRFYNDSDFVWRRFDPMTTDSTANISTLAVKSTVDSGYIFMFGGYNNPNTLNIAQRYTFPAAPPPPIGITGIHEKIPSEFILKQNYPNPFNPVTNIEFGIPASFSGNVTLSVYDINGKLVVTLFSGYLKSGVYKTNFEAGGVSSGVYFYVLQTPAVKIARKLVVLK